MNFGQEDSDTIAIHLKVASGRGHRYWYKQSWEEEQDKAEKDVRSQWLVGIQGVSLRWNLCTDNLGYTIRQPADSISSGMAGTAYRKL